MQKIVGVKTTETVTLPERGVKEKAGIKYQPQSILLFGIWAYKIDGGVDYSEPFPPRSLEGKIKLLSMFPGEKHSLDEVNTNWLKQVIKDGMTHIMFGHGDTCQVIEHLESGGE